MPSIPTDVIAAAQAGRRKHGILASIILAQWALESRWGQKVSGTFNFFGVKAGPGEPSTICPTHEWVNGRRVEIDARFRNFTSVEEAFDYHANLLATGEAYKLAWSVRNNYVAYANALTGRYATDPNYGRLLIQIIQGDNLLRYDVPPDPPPPANENVAFGADATNKALG